ncbi:hypothetical protein [Iningainema tapete]|uniref:Ferritin-like domain-containing protein n=1 Tax=Iningainema tapete BLCC-T55 TaxID=2748662 RepID=A0A8J6XGB3_9CYAN|nr:hypothetical protein [Iningainema tapete]MBD2771184.1 hypothetical protein [Iningainema tapete BLCC-T55]
MSLLSWVTRNRDELICLVLAWVFSKLPNRLSLLKKLEVGVFFFCWRQALQAQAEGNSTLNLILKEQAESEYHHAQAFCTLTGSKLELSADKLFNRESKNAQIWSTVNWDASESFQADGLSRKYYSAKAFFGGHQARDFSWENKLAFMTVLESFQACFYRKLLQFLPLKVGRSLLAICNEEANHSITLRMALAKMTDSSTATKLMRKWKQRLYLGLLILPLDLVGILLSVVMTNIKNAARTRLHNQSQSRQ